MWLTKNEKAVLKLLIEDAKLSDSSIANTLNISSQAIGRIRKRLEKDVIKGYTVNLNSKNLGVNIIALLKVSFNTSNENIDVEKLEQKLKNFPEVIMILKTLSGVFDYIILASFKNMDDLERFITEKKKEGTFDSYYVIKELIPLPNNCVLKKSEKNLLYKLIDGAGTKKTNLEFN